MIRHLDHLDSLRLARNSGRYEKLETIYARRVVRRGWRIADIGAHIGYWTDQLAQMVGPTGSVDSFEPNPDNEALLRRNISAMANVNVYGVALADKSGIHELSLNIKNTGDGCLYLRPDRPAIPVVVLTLDELNPAPRSYDYIKIDVQGAEVRVLRGARETIKRNPRMIVMVEFYPTGLKAAGSSPQEFLSLLKEMEFRIVNIVDPNEIFKSGSPRLKTRKHTNLFCFGPEAEIPS